MELSAVLKIAKANLIPTGTILGQKELGFAASDVAASAFPFKTSTAAELVSVKQSSRRNACGLKNRSNLRISY